MTNKNLEIIEFLKENGIEKLYHFTDRANIDSIIKHKGLLSWKECYLRKINIPAPGGSVLSRKLDERYHLENYVRLSFSNEHPMMFAAVEDGRIDDPVILEIDLGILGERKFKFSDTNAASNGVRIGESKEFLKNNLRFELLNEKYYDLETDERPYYQAEVLIDCFVPIAYISNITKFSSVDDLLKNHNESNLQDLSTKVPRGVEIGGLEEQNHYFYKPRGAKQMMILFGLGYIGWIVFAIYCMIYRWTDVEWYNYLFGGLLALLGGFVVVGLPWYTIYLILSKFNIVDALD